MRSRFYATVGSVVVGSLLLVSCSSAGKPEDPDQHSDGLGTTPAEVTAVAGGDECAELWVVPCLDRSVQVVIEVPGTEFALHYASDRLPGRTGAPSADVTGASLGGWTLDVLAVYVPQAGVLLSGDGTRRTVEAVADGDRLYVATRDGQWVHELDESGRLLATRSAVTGDVRRSFEYDDDGRLARIEAPQSPALVVSWDEESIGLAVEDVPVMTLALGDDGLVREATSLLRGTVDRFTYADGGLLTDWVDPMGALTRYAHDDAGLLTTVTTDEQVTELIGEGDRVAVVQDGQEMMAVVRPDGLDGRWEWVGSDGAVVVETVSGTEHEIVRPDGSQTSITLADHPTFGAQARYAATATVRGTDLPETTVTTALSVDGTITAPTRVERTVDDGTGTTSTVWDAQERTITGTSAEGRVSTLAVGSNGMLERVEHRGSTLIEIERDDDGLPTAATVAGVRGTAEWSPGAASVVGGGGEAEVRYEADTSVSAITDPLGRVLSMDVAGNVLTRYLDGAVLSTLTSDGATTVRSYPDAAGGVDVHTTTVSDDASRVTSGWAGGTQSATVFGQDGTLERSTGGSHDVVFRWADDGELVDLTRGDVVLVPGDLGIGGTWTGLGPDPLAVAYTDGGEGLGGTVEVGGSDHPLVFDRDGKLTRLGPVQVQRDRETGRATARTVGNVSTRISYDDAGRTTRVALAGTGSAAGVTGAITFERDESLRVVGTDGDLAGLLLDATYGYDAAGRLTSATRDGSTWDYRWDTRDNLVEVTGPGAVGQVTVDRANRVTAAGGLTYTYDADHALAERSDGLRLTATPHGALETVTLPDGRQVDYLLDGAERRVGRTVEGVATDRFTYYDELRPAAWYDGDGGLRATFFYDDADRLAAVVKGDRTYAVVTDQVGSPLLVIDAETGEVAQQITYDPFGRVLSDTAPGFQPFGFLGALADPDTGLVNLGAREYDPALGRFVSPDPVLDDGSLLNLYAYANGDPVNRLDRDGLRGHVGMGTMSVSLEDLQELDEMFAAFSAEMDGFLESLAPTAQGVGSAFVAWNGLQLVDATKHGSVDDLMGILKGPGMRGVDYIPRDVWSKIDRIEKITDRLAKLGVFAPAGKLGKLIPVAGHLLNLAGAVSAARDIMANGLRLRNGMEFLAGALGLLLPLLALVGLVTPMGMLLLGLLLTMLSFCLAIAFCASLFGDPHTSTADGAYFSYQGAGEFWAVRSRDGTLDVQVRQEPIGAGLAITTAVAVRTEGSVVELYGTDGRVVLDGQPLTLAVGTGRDLDGEGRLERVDELHYRVLAVDGESGVEARLTPSMVLTTGASAATAETLLGGILGTFDGIVNNEWTMPDGTVLDMSGDDARENLYQRFGPSWRVTEDEMLLEGPSVWDPDYPATHRTTADLDPELRRWAEGVCRAAGVTVEPFLDSCILDVAVTGDPSFAADAAAALRDAVGTGRLVRDVGARDPGPQVGTGTVASWHAQIDGLDGGFEPQMEDTHGQRVFLTGRGDDGGIALAIDGATGAEVWRVSGVNPHCAPLALADGRVVVVASKGGALADEAAGALVTLDGATGAVVDTVTWPEESRGDNGIYCGPSVLIDGDRVLTHGYIGDLIMWDVSGTPSVVWVSTDRAFAWETGAVAVDGGFVVRLRDGDQTALILVDGATGEVLDRHLVPGTQTTSGLVGANNVVVTSLDSAQEGVASVVTGLRVSGGTITPVWSVESADDRESDIRGRLRALSVAGDTVAAEHDAGFLGIDLATGRIEFNVEKPSWHNHHDPVALIDGKIYNGVFGGVPLYVIDTATGETVEYGNAALAGQNGPTVGGYRYGPMAGGHVLVFARSDDGHHLFGMPVE